MAEISMEGLEEFQQLLEDMTLTEADERNSIRKAIKVIADEVESNSPVGKSGKLSKVKVSVKKDGFGVYGEVRTGAFYDIFNEIGTSYQKKNVGYFERSVTSTQDKAVEILVKELLDKAK